MHVNIPSVSARQQPGVSRDHTLGKRKTLVWHSLWLVTLFCLGCLLSWNVALCSSPAWVPFGFAEELNFTQRLLQMAFCHQPRRIKGGLITEAGCCCYLSLLYQHLTLDRWSYIYYWVNNWCLCPRIAWIGASSWMLLSHCLPPTHWCQSHG